MKCALVIVFALSSHLSFGQEYQLFRQNDNLAVLDTLSKKNTYQKLKLIHFSHGTLSFGGSLRFQTESFINEEFDKTQDQTDYWFLQRTLFHTHVKLGKQFELFSELNSSLIASKQTLSPVDKDALSINQLFARYQVSDHLNILLGRQNVRLGSGRLVDLREGPNVRLSFDMAQMQYQDQKTSITAFYAIPVQQQEGVFDNIALDRDEVLSALYWTQSWTSDTHTDFYVLYKEEANKAWNAGTANDHRASLGFRHFGALKDFKFNNEFVYQFGSFGDQNISAWTASVHIEKAFFTARPVTLGIKTEVISGDTDAGDGRLNTFDALYPRGAYFGRVARFGPSNLIDVHPSVETQLGSFHLSVDYVAFWRFSTHDGIYNPALILTYPSLNSERFIAHQVGMIVNHQICQYLNVELESNMIIPGAFLQRSGLDDTLYHVVLTAEIIF